MTWEAALLSAYSSNTSSSLDDQSDFFNNSVIPAFGDIERCLSEHVINSRITPHKNLAKLHIEDKSFGIFVFVVAVIKEENNVRFYSLLNGEKWNAPDFEYSDLKALGKEVVLHEFIKHFLSRDKNQEKLHRKLIKRRGEIGAALNVSEISILTGLRESSINNALYYEKQRQKEIEEYKENAELIKFRKHIRTEFNAKNVKDVVSSIGRIKEKRVILKYIGEDEIPESGYIFRASMKHLDTDDVYSIRIYDNNFKLISSCTPKLKKQDQTLEPV